MSLDLIGTLIDLVIMLCLLTIIYLQLNERGPDATA